MPAIRRVSIRQLEILLEFAEENRDIVLGRCLRGPHGSLVAKQAWDSLASKINAVAHGVTKTGEKWRRYWVEWKCKTKVKGADWRRSYSQTGGGEKKNTPLTDLEERILQIIGRISVEGIAGVRIPFNAPSTSSQPTVTDNRSRSSSSISSNTPEMPIEWLEDEIDPLTLFPPTIEPSPTTSPTPSAPILFTPRDLPQPLRQHTPTQQHLSHQPPHRTSHRTPHRTPHRTRQQSRSPPVQQSRSPPVQQSRSPPVQRSRSPPVQRSRSPPVQRSRSPPVQPAPRQQRTRRRDPRNRDVPQWALSLEERRLAIEERHVTALESLSATLISIDQRLHNIFNMLGNK